MKNIKNWYLKKINNKNNHHKLSIISKFATTPPPSPYTPSILHCRAKCVDSVCCWTINRTLVKLRSKNGCQFFLFLLREMFPTFFCITFKKSNQSMSNAIKKYFFQMLLLLQAKKEEIIAPKMTRDSTMQSGTGGGHTAARHIPFKLTRQRCESQPGFYACIVSAYVTVSIDVRIKHHTSQCTDRPIVSRNAAYINSSSSGSGGDGINSISSDSKQLIHTMATKKYLFSKRQIEKTYIKIIEKKNDLQLDKSHASRRT